MGWTKAGTMLIAVVQHAAWRCGCVRCHKAAGRTAAALGSSSTCLAAGAPIAEELQRCLWSPQPHAGSNSCYACSGRIIIFSVVQAQGIHGRAAGRQTQPPRLIRGWTHASPARAPTPRRRPAPLDTSAAPSPRPAALAGTRATAAATARSCAHVHRGLAGTWGRRVACMEFAVVGGACNPTLHQPPVS